MNWTFFVAAWICLGVATLGLALYRKFLTMREDDYIHIEQWRAPEVEQQQAMARKIHSIDKYGETLTILTLLGGLALAIAWIYAAVSKF